MTEPTAFTQKVHRKSPESKRFPGFFRACPEAGQVLSRLIGTRVRSRRRAEGLKGIRG